MSHPDRITVRGVTAHGYHGVHAEERRDGQRFVVDVDLHLDLRAASVSDRLTDSVDYGEIARLVVAAVEGPAAELLETVAARIAEAVLDLVPSGTVAVTVHKPQAPIAVSFDDVSVTVNRSRS